MSPVGTSESAPDVSLVILDPVLFQKGEKLFLEADLSMMLLLPVDVSNCVIYLRDPDAERSVPFLPRKAATQLGEVVVYPLGRTALDQ